MKKIEFNRAFYIKAGLQRINSLGSTQKSTGGIYIEPLRNRRIAMQAKTSTSVARVKEFAEFVENNGDFDLAYFATHSHIRLSDELSDIIELLDAPKLSKKAIQQGLVDWLIERAI